MRESRAGPRGTLFRSTDVVSFHQYLISHLKQRGVALAYGLHRPIAALHFDQPDVHLPLHHEAGLVDGRHMRVVRPERWIAPERALHRDGRTRLERIRTSYREYRRAIR